MSEMSDSCPFSSSDKEPEQALVIVYNYFDRKCGNVSDELLQNAMILLYELYRKKEMRPLVLANKAIAILDSRVQPHTPRAA